MISPVTLRSLLSLLALVLLMDAWREFRPTCAAAHTQTSRKSKKWASNHVAFRKALSVPVPKFSRTPLSDGLSPDVPFLGCEAHTFVANKSALCDYQDPDPNCALRKDPTGVTFACSQPREGFEMEFKEAVQKLLRYKRDAWGMLTMWMHDPLPAQGVLKRERLTCMEAHGDQYLEYLHHHMDVAGLARGMRSSSSTGATHNTMHDISSSTRGGSSRSGSSGSSTRLHIVPFCALHCCTAEQFARGRFVKGPIGRMPVVNLGHLYVTEGCRIFSHNLATVATCTSKLNVRRIVFVGDSMLRQLFMQAVNWARGSTSNVDYDRWRSARYAAWDDRDELEISGVHLEEGSWRGMVSAPRIRALGQGAAAPLLELYFMWGSEYDKVEERLQVLQAEWGQAEQAEQAGRAVLVTGAYMHYIVQRYADPGSDARRLQDTQLGRIMSFITTPRSWLHHTYLLTTPVERYAGAGGHQRQFAAERDQYFASVAANHSAVVTLVDWARMASGPVKPPGVTHDIHYACKLGYQDATYGPQGPPDQPSGHSAVGCIVLNEQGGCSDPMDLLLLQTILNTMCARAWPS